MATACLPSASSSSSMAALVMEEVMMTPGATSILTDAVDGALLYGDDVPDTGCGLEILMRVSFRVDVCSASAL